METYKDYTKFEPFELMQICESVYNYWSCYQLKYKDETTFVLDYVKFYYLINKATMLGRKCPQWIEDCGEWYNETSLAYICRAWYKNNFITYPPSPSSEKIQPYLKLLDIIDIHNHADISYEYRATLMNCRDSVISIISSNINNYERPFLLELEKARRNYNEAKDRCKPSEWEDKKIQLKNENIDKLKANHFGKFFHDYAAYPDRRFRYALVDCFPYASSKYIEEKETNIYIKIEEFCYLQSLYCLLHNEDPIPPEFRKQEPTPHSETRTKQKNSNTTPTQTLDNYTPEERQKIVDCYTGLAGFMGIDTHWITDIFKPNDDKLWAAIKADRQIPLMHPKRTDGTNIAPILNLLGVLCHTKRLENNPSSYYKKLSEHQPHLDKKRIESLVKNGNRKELRGLANFIKKRLDKLTEQ